MATIDKPVMNGAQMLDALVKSGTGKEKLTVPRMVLEHIHRKYGRIARADELLDAMEKAGRMEPWESYPVTPDLTIEKARAFAMSGDWKPQEADGEVPIEKILLGMQEGQALPPEPELTPVEEAAEVLDPPSPFVSQAKATELPSMELKPVPKRKPAKSAKTPSPLADETPVPEAATA